METVIRTLPELRALKERKSRRGIGRIVLELPGASDDDVRKAENQINKSLHACGCGTAAVFLLTGLVAIVAVLLIRPGYYELANVRTLLGIFGLLVVLALLGKMVGLVIAELRLQSAIDRFGN